LHDRKGAENGEEKQAEFTCELDDEWDVATLLRAAFHEP
jgi:hypothetical protein